MVYILECIPYKYGPNCVFDCGHCRDGMPCSTDTGLCTKGCEDGWTGDLCLKGKSQVQCKSLFCVIVVCKGWATKVDFCVWQISYCVWVVYSPTIKRLAIMLWFNISFFLFAVKIDAAESQKQSKRICV